MKQPKTSRTNYRIGEFAEYMGVTPDFLKHYEECGLLDVHHSENGYRYFNFDQSSRILEYMRLRNYGVTVKEMRAMLMADADEALLLLDKKVEELRRQADRISAVLEEHKRVHAWQQKRRIKPVDWEVREVEAHYFLPHTMDSNFIRDERIYPLLKIWTSWLPIAKSAMHLKAVESGDKRYLPCWGVILPKSIAERYGIPTSEVVKVFPEGKAFVYHFAADESAFSMEKLSRADHPAFRQMKTLNLRPADNLFLIVEMKLINPDGSRRGGYGRFVMPIRGS